MQRVVVIPCRRFGTTFRSHLQMDSWPLKIGQIICPETSVRKYHYWLRNSPEKRISRISSVYAFFLFWRITLLLLSHLGLGLPGCFFPSGFSTKTLYAPLLLHTCHIPCPFIILDFRTRIIFGFRKISWRSSLCYLLHCSVTSFLLGPNIFLSTPYLNTFSLCSSLSVRDDVLHPYETAGKIIVLIR